MSGSLNAKEYDDHVLSFISTYFQSKLSSNSYITHTAKNLPSAEKLKYIHIHTEKCIYKHIYIGGVLIRLLQKMEGSTLELHKCLMSNDVHFLRSCGVVGVPLSICTDTTLLFAHEVHTKRSRLTCCNH